MASMNYKVLLDVSGSAFGSAFSATDVTTKAVAGAGFAAYTVTWGRQDQYSSINPTTVDGSLLNTDGTFTPGNASGTYYPKIRRNLRRRVQVVVNSTTVPISEDYATSLEVVPSNTAPATTVVAGTDILSRFGGTPSTSDPNAPAIGTTLRSFVAEEAMLDSPACLYMLQEADGSTTFADVTGACPPLAVTHTRAGEGVVTAGQAVTATNTAFYGGTTVQINNAPYYGTTSIAGSGLAASGLPAITGAAWEIWVQMPTTLPPTGYQSVILYTSTGPIAVNLRLTDAGQIALVYTTASSSTVLLAPSTTMDDGLLHHIVGTISGTTWSLYIDGVFQNSTTAVAAIAAFTSLSIGIQSPPSTTAMPFSGQVAYCAVYPAALSSARITAHYNAGVTAFIGERTDQRITRLLSYRTNTGASVDTGLGTVGLQSTVGRSLQECLFEVAQLEGGVVFTDGLGQINFRSRSRLFNPTPSVTLDMSVGGIDFGSNWREDTQGVVNDVTITNQTTGSDQRVFNAASITTDGEFATNYSLPLNADTDALNMAGWIVVNGVQQQLAAVPLVINLLHLTNAQAAAVLGIKPLDCIQLTSCPVPAPSATMTFIVQGGTTSLAADASSVTLNVTPLPYPVGVWDTTNWDAAGVTWAF